MPNSSSNLGTRFIPGLISPCSLMTNGTGRARGADFNDDDDGYETWEGFESRHVGLFVCLMLGVSLVFALFLYHNRWSRRQRRRSRKSTVVSESDAYIARMVQRLVPWLGVERHRFQGMRQKSDPVSVQFEGIGLALADGTEVLRNVSGEFHAGTMNAIMGPSGAGKTTCMNVICGKTTCGKVAGSVCINGKDRDSSAFASAAGYVPQDDVVHEGMTVSEQIEFSARLRGPRRKTRLRCKQITEDVLSIMQLSSCRDAIVGSVESRGISGGQRKRVNIGLELAADPTVLFLDEATSGLDATAALTVVHGLKTLTKLGTTVIMVIHQPRYELFTLFEDVLLLGTGGWLAYLGPSVGATAYFEGLGFQMPPNTNPADWLMDVISREDLDGLIGEFEAEESSSEASDRSIWSSGLPDVEDGGQPSVERSAASAAETLLQAWMAVEPSGTGALREAGLHRLLSHCAGIEPQAQVVSALLKRMAAPGEDSITRQDFLTYMMGLQSVLGGNELLSVGPDKAGSVHTQGSQDFSAQFVVCLHRCLIQWWRNNQKRSVFYGVFFVAGLLMAWLDRFVNKQPQWEVTSYQNLHTTVALLTCIFSQNAFGASRTVFWRERARRLNVCSYFLATVIVTSVDIVLQVYIFGAMYYLIRRDVMSFFDFWGPCLLVAYVSSGMGYLMASVLPLQQGPFVAVLVSLISCGMLGTPVTVDDLMTGGLSEVFLDVTSITRWSAGMTFLMHLDTVRSRGLRLRESVYLRNLEYLYREKPAWQDKLGHVGTGVTCLIALGTILHVAAYLGFRFANRHKQL